MRYIDELELVFAPVKTRRAYAAQVFKAFVAKRDMILAQNQALSTAGLFESTEWRHLQIARKYCVHKRPTGKESFRHVCRWCWAEYSG